MWRFLTMTPLAGIGEIAPGADLAQTVAHALVASRITVGPYSVVVVAQKIVSKAEGRIVYLDDVTPSPRAQELAAITGKSPALVELILRESAEVLRVRPNILIVRHRLGYVIANAGIDQSNVVGTGGRPVCLLLPEDPEGSARRVRAGVAALGLPAPAVIISDSFGRPWRRGVINVAIGSSGLPALIDRRGDLDRYRRPLRSTEVAFADALAAAAGIIMGEGDEGTPVVHIGGAEWSLPENGAIGLIRPIGEDLFR